MEFYLLTIDGVTDGYYAGMFGLSFAVSDAFEALKQGKDVTGSEKPIGIARKKLAKWLEDNQGYGI